MDKNVPEIRFKGFCEDWSSFPLEEGIGVVDGDRGHNYPNGEDLKKQGHTLFLNASNVTKNGFRFHTKQYITQEKSQSLGNGKLVLDDIILTSRGSIGHIAWYDEDIKRKVPFARINSGMLILRSDNNLCPSIIAQYLKSPIGAKKINLISFGSAQPQLTKASVSKLKITIPENKNEQSLVGKYFQKLDSLIIQHQQKHDKLSNIKKAMLKKLFPKAGEIVPEIRFKGFSGEWTEKGLGTDVAEIIGGGTPSTSISEFWGGDIDWYSPTEIGKNVYAEGSQKKITNLGLKSSSAKILPANKTVLFTSRAGIGDMAILTKPGATNQGFQSFVVKEGFSAYFLYSAGKLIKEYALKNASGSTFLEISGKQLALMKLLIPSRDEQNKIGDYFQKLDELIKQHQEQLTKLNNIKQACLTKMFV
jgi:type I restriction enzyme S subunit